MYSANINLNSLEKMTKNYQEAIKTGIIEAGVDTSSVTIAPNIIKLNETPIAFRLKIKSMIKDVNILVENKVVEVLFTDGTKEKAVCLEPDVYSFETAVSICIAKKAMGGSNEFNNAVKRALKVYDNKLKKEAADKAEKERIEKKHEKRRTYKERREARRLQEEKERQIEIQKEAYVRAMKEISGEQ